MLRTWQPEPFTHNPPLREYGQCSNAASFLNWLIFLPFFIKRFWTRPPHFSVAICSFGELCLNGLVDLAVLNPVNRNQPSVCVGLLYATANCTLTFPARSPQSTQNQKIGFAIARTARCVKLTDIYVSRRAETLISRSQRGSIGGGYAPPWTRWGISHFSSTSVKPSSPSGHTVRPQFELLF